MTIPNTYAMNFGTNNHFWPRALKDNVVLMHEGVDAWDMIQSGRIDELKAVYNADHKSATGENQSPGWLTIWVSLSSTIRSTVSYRVLHIADGYLWWADTTGHWHDLGVHDVPYKYDNNKTVLNRIISRPVNNQWSNRTRSGELLEISKLHPMVGNIAHIRGTMRHSLEDKAAYIDALLNDKDTSKWESLRAWRKA